MTTDAERRDLLRRGFTEIAPGHWLASGSTPLDAIRPEEQHAADRYAECDAPSREPVWLPSDEPEETT